MPKLVYTTRSNSSEPGGGCTHDLPYLKHLGSGEAKLEPLFQRDSSCF